MSQPVQNAIQATTDAVQSTAIAHTVGATTVGMGVIAWLMTNAGWMAALAGGCLSLVLMVVQIRKGRLERRLLKLKIEEAETNARISNRGNP